MYTKMIHFLHLKSIDIIIYKNALRIATGYFKFIGWDWVGYPLTSR